MHQRTEPEYRECGHAGEEHGERDGCPDEDSFVTVQKDNRCTVTDLNSAMPTLSS